MRVLMTAIFIGLMPFPALAQVAGEKTTVAAMNAYAAQAGLKSTFKGGGCKPADAGSFACDITVKSVNISQPYSFSAIFRKKNGSAARFNLPIADGSQASGAALGATVAASVLADQAFDLIQVSQFTAQQMQAAIAQQHPQTQQVNGARFTVSSAGESGFLILLEKAAGPK